MSSAITLLFRFIALISIIIIEHDLTPSNLFVSSQDYEDNVHLIRRKQICDINYCDSVVNKCKLTNRCSCHWKKDAICSKSCIECLEEKFGKCCGCVGLCPIEKNPIHSSHVGNLSKNETDQELFELLTDEEDIHKRWNIVNIDNGHKISHPAYEAGLRFAYRDLGDNNVYISTDENYNKLSCRVAFINRQLSMSKCKSFCVSMGAFSFRWFYEGCCQCVGKYCINYGIDEPKCLMNY